MILIFVLFFLIFRKRFKDLTDWFIALLFILTMIRVVDLTLFIIMYQNPYASYKFFGVSIYDFTFIQCIDLIYIIITLFFSILFLVHESVVKIKNILK